MEPTVKYEICDNVYSPNINDEVFGTKRNYNDMQQTSYPRDLPSTATSNQFEGFCAPTTQRNKFIRINNYDEVPIKRYRRGDAALLFSAPFFEIHQEYDPTNGSITARCLSCHAILRGHKNVTSNFIKHMKRLHPQLNQIYENIKLRKNRTTRPTSTKNSMENKDSSQKYFDENAFLEDGLGEVEENISETTDNSETTSMSLNMDGCKNTITSSVEDETDSDDSQSHKVDFTPGNLELMNGMIEQKLSKFVTREEMQELSRKITNTENNTETIQNSSIQAQLKALEKQCEEQRTLIIQNQKAKFHLQKELESLERSFQNGKLIIRNIKVTNSQQPETAIQHMFNEILQLPRLPEFSKVRSIGRSNSGGDKHHIMIDLANPHDAGLIFKNCYKLKNTGIYIEPPMSVHAKKRKNKLLVLRKELLRRKSNLQVLVRNMHLIVNGQHFHWDEVDGLCVGDNWSIETSRQESAVEYLKNITGLDFKEFLNILRNYDVH